MKLTVQNEMKISFPSCSNNEALGRSVITAFASQLDPTLEEICDLKTAVSEAVTNCIVHAYKDTIGTIYITAHLLEGRRIRVRIRDKGCGMEDVVQAMEPLFTTGGEERAGLGFAVMQSFTDKVKVASRPGKGTTVTLYKRFSERNTRNGEE